MPKTVMERSGLDTNGLFLLSEALYLILLRRLPPNGAHQPPASCTRSRGRRDATTSLNHRWPDVATGKSTPPRGTIQAPDLSEHGAVAGRLQRLVGRTACWATIADAAPSSVALATVADS